jgi:integrase/recombinase XerD
MVKINGKWAFAPVVERDGKIIRDYVQINGKEEHHPEGRYYLDWYESGKKRRLAGPLFQEIVAAARAKFVELQARKAGLLPAPETNRLRMTDAIDQYLKYIRKQRSHRTYLTYRPTLTGLFRSSYTKTYLDEVTRDDMLRFMSDCFDAGLSARTIYSKLVIVLQLFVKSSDWPEYVETIRPIYAPEEIWAMLQVATPEEAILLKFFLASGFRKDEVRYTTWYDVDFHTA